MLMTNQRDTPPTLSTADAQAFDTLASQGFDAEAMEQLEGESRERAQAITDLLSMLDSGSDDVPSDDECRTLVDATMARIKRAEDDRRDRMRMDNHPVMLGRGLRFRIAEGLAVAAVLAMATATLWSFGTSARMSAVSNGARRNLGELHAGMSAFNDATGGVPLKEAAAPVGRYLHGRHATQLDLHTVAAEGYCDPDCLRNPRRPGAGLNGFSFAVFAPGGEPHLKHAHMILIGDRNPALDGLLQGQGYEDALEGADWGRRLIDRPSVVFADGRTADLDGAAHEGDGIWTVEPAQGPAPIEIFLAH